MLSYVQRPMTVRHYILQPDDTADKKKTLIDFLGQSKCGIYPAFMQLTSVLVYFYTFCNSRLQTGSALGCAMTRTRYELCV